VKINNFSVGGGEGERNKKYRKAVPQYTVRKLVGRLKCYEYWIFEQKMKQTGNRIFISLNVSFMPSSVESAMF
jgi:hypothetical protein